VALHSLLSICKRIFGGFLGYVGDPKPYVLLSTPTGIVDKSQYTSKLDEMVDDDDVTLSPSHILIALHDIVKLSLLAEVAREPGHCQ
jgi:hypothetical protein